MHRSEHLICELAEHWKIPYKSAEGIHEKILRLTSKENKVSVKAIES